MGEIDEQVDVDILLGKESEVDVEEGIRLWKSGQVDVVGIKGDDPNVQKEIELKKENEVGNR